MQQFDTVMRRWVTAGVVLAVFAAGVARQAEAQVYVVDTGPGAGTGGLTMSANQYLAGQFTLDAGHEINAFEGWMVYLNIINNLPVHLVVYGDANGLPDWTDVVFTQLFFVLPSGFTPGWHGVDGLELPLYGGTYWLAFEVDSAVATSGAMPPTPLPELDSYAVDTGAGWFEQETANLGIRILPEPGLAMASACGCLLLGLSARGRRDLRPGARDGGRRG